MVIKINVLDFIPEEVRQMVRDGLVDTTYDLVKKLTGDRFKVKSSSSKAFYDLIHIHKLTW